MNLCTRTQTGKRCLADSNIEMVQSLVTKDLKAASVKMATPNSYHCCEEREDAEKSSQRRAQWEL